MVGSAYSLVRINGDHSRRRLHLAVTTDVSAQGARARRRATHSPTHLHCLETRARHSFTRNPGVNQMGTEFKRAWAHACTGVIGTKVTLRYPVYTHGLGLMPGVISELLSFPISVRWTKANS